jgi:Asp-tRNA(Asn)/Glu-tRNA(Gln) amidotransferase A subunit family amidase
MIPRAALNPHNPECTTAGSSGGAAGSLAAGIGTFAIATNAAGSICVPAAVNGVLGIKLCGSWPWSFNGLHGIMTRSTSDACYVLGALAHLNDSSVACETFLDAIREPLESVRQCKIAFSPLLGFTKDEIITDERVLDEVSRVVQLLRKEGFAIVEVPEIPRVLDQQSTFFEMARCCWFSQ